MITKKDVVIIDGNICISTGALSEVLNMSRKTLSEWEKKGCPKEDRGLWNLAEVLKWRGMVDVSGSKTEESATVKALYTQKQDLEVQLKQAQLDAIKLKNAIARGDYIEKGEISTALQRIFIVLKTSLMTMSKTIAIELMSFGIDINIVRQVEIKVQNKMLDGLENISINGIYKAPKTKRKLA